MDLIIGKYLFDNPFVLYLVCGVFYLLIFFLVLKSIFSKNRKHFYLKLIGTYFLSLFLFGLSFLTQIFVERYLGGLSSLKYIEQISIINPVFFFGFFFGVLGIPFLLGVVSVWRQENFLKSKWFKKLYRIVIATILIFISNTPLFFLISFLMSIRSFFY